MSSTILGIDPGTGTMGLAVLQGSKLIAWGVRELRNGERPYNVIGQARSAVLELIRDHRPDLVGIEKPLRLATKRAALMSVIVEELHARSRELGLRVVELFPREVRTTLLGNEHATKFEVARLLAARFPKLRSVLPRPPHPVLGYRPRDKYWLHMFDALAVAVVAESSTMSARL